MGLYYQAFTGGAAGRGVAAEDILRRLRNVPVQAVIVGWSEDPALYRELGEALHRRGAELWLWFPVFSEHTLREGLRRQTGLLTGGPVGGGGFGPPPASFAENKNYNKGSILMEKAIRRYWPVFVLPTLIAFIIGFVWPFIWGAGLSFCKFTTVNNVQFVGLSNYAMIWSDNTFTHAFWFTAAFTVVSTLLINVLAFAIALLLTRGMHGTNASRTIFFLPNLIGGIVLGYIWQILLNGLLSSWGKSLLALNATYGFWGLIILMCWQQIGYMMIIYIAGLQNVPVDLVEAARIDGATSSQILFKIKIPMVMPSVTICTFLTLTNSFKLFDQNLSLTAGEPAKQSMMLAYNIYDTFYARSGPQWKGIGQAKAVVFFLFVVVISLLQLHFTRSKEVQA